MRLDVFEFLEGVRFDLSALVYINIPILILLVFPTNFRCKKGYQRLVNILFYGVNTPFILLNNIDIEYFRFTQKRSTIDFFQLMQLGDDAKNIIPQYLKDYWPITLFSILQIYLLLKIKEIPQYRFSLNFKSISKQLLVLFFAGGIFIFSARGGSQLKPIKPINAGELSNSQNTSLILNTPFCILHSLDENELKAYKGALMIISHDRQFLKNLTNRLFWLDRGKLRTHGKGFAAFEEWSEEILRSEEVELKKLDKKIAEETDWSRKGITARRARNEGRMARWRVRRF